METLNSERFKQNVEEPILNIPETIHFASEAHRLEFLAFVTGEIASGADRVGIFGSQVKGRHTPASDTDVIVVNEKADGKEIPYNERVGRPLYFGKERPGQGFIHVSRVTRKMAEDPFNKKRKELRKVLKGALWVWERNDKPK